ATALPGLGWLHAVPGLRVIMPLYAWPLVLLPLAQAAGRGVEVLGTRVGGTRGLVGLALAVGVLAGLVIEDHALDRTVRGVVETPAGVWGLLVPPLLASVAVIGGRLVQRIR